MSNARKKKDAEWEVHKRDIETLYLTQNKTREEVMQVMEETHGFRASKAQYIRKFKQWNFEKNSTNEKWKFIAGRLEKRELDGKESETYINGKLISRKKVKREVSRYYVPSRQISDTAPSPAPPNGVEIRTPGREKIEAVEYFHIPWFEFEDLVELQFERLRTSAQSHPSMYSLHSGQFLDRPLDLFNVTSPPQVDIFTNQWKFQCVGLGDQVGDTSDFLWSDQSIQDLDAPIQRENEVPSHITTQISSREARSLFADIVGNSVDPDSSEYLSSIASHLKDILIERQDGELVRNVKRMISSSILESSFQLLRYSVYLSSNNLLSDHYTDKLLRWIVQSGQFAVIDRLIRMRKPTTEIFASNLLVSAARLQDVETVRAFIALGIDVNTPAGQYIKNTALHEAIIQHDINLVKFLLDAGAYPNGIGPDQNISPLQKAVSTFNSAVSLRRSLEAQAGVNLACKKNGLELVLLLLKAGADVNIAPHEDWFPRTLLLCAVEQSDPELVQMLVDWKANVNLMTETAVTALQGAARGDNIEIVQLLLDAGADVDAPAGERNQSARAAAAESYMSDHLISPIQYAAYHDNTEMVQMLLDSGADVDGYVPTENEYQKEDYNDDIEEYPLRTPLQSAVSHENAVLVRLLLSAGAEIDGQGYGPTPLQIAAQRGNIKLAKLLLRNGAAVNAAARKIHGRTALQAAAERGNQALVQILMDVGADVNAQAAPKFGRTALQGAAQAGDIELVEALITLGADVNAEPSPVEGRTCLQAAAEIGHTEMIKMLLKFGAEVNAPAAGEKGRTALQAALERNHISVVDMLLDAGADINAAPSKEGGLSALCASIKNDNLELVRQLLRTANPNGETSREPPLVKAAKLGATDIVQCLIQAGANVNGCQKNDPSWTALEIAIEMGHLNIIHILLAAGANINGSTLEKGEFKRSPLEIAVWCDSTELVRLLLSKGANVNASPGCALPESTALGEALSRLSINEEIVHLLVEAGADVNRASSRKGIPLVTGVKRLDVVQILLNAGAKVNGTGSDGTTALQASIMYGDINIDIVRVLLDAGADVNAPARREYGLTALQAAAKEGKVSLVNLLLQHGADSNAPAGESYGATALQAAVIGGHLRIALMLLKAGADVNAPAAKIDGRTALEAAAEHGHLDIVSLLLKNDTDIESLEIRCKRAAKLAISNGNIFISKLLNEYKKD